MKDGTGGDPFADDPTDLGDAGDSVEATNASETESSGQTVESGSAVGAGTDATTTGGEADSQLPYYYRRDTVKEGRDQVPFFLRDHVQDLEDDFIDDLETRLNTSNVYKADAREAALQVVYENHSDEVADLLREWGYDVE